MELKVDLWLDYSYFVWYGPIYTFYENTNNILKKIFLCVNMYVIGLWLFFRIP